MICYQFGIAAGCPLVCRHNPVARFPPLGQDIGIGHHLKKAVEQITAVSHGNADSRAFQEVPFLPEIIHEGTVKDDLAPGSGLKYVLPAPWNKTSLAKKNRRKAVCLEQFTDTFD